MTSIADNSKDSITFHGLQHHLIEDTTRIIQTLHSILDNKESMILPFIRLYISANEQTSLNN
jgi:hypothetical protein